MKLMSRPGVETAFSGKCIIYYEFCLIFSMDRLFKKLSSFAFKIASFFDSFELRKCPVTRGTGKLNHSPATVLLLKLQKLRIKNVRSYYDTCVFTVVIFAVYAMLEKTDAYIHFPFGSVTIPKYHPVIKFYLVST